jgi:hypothetical protein
MIAGREDYSSGRGRGCRRGRGRSGGRGQWFDEEAKDMDTSIGEDVDAKNSGLKRRIVWR